MICGSSALPRSNSTAGIVGASSRMIATGRPPSAARAGPQSASAAKLLEHASRYAQSDRQPEFFVIWAESEIGRQDAAHALALLAPVLKLNPSDARAQRLKGKALL